MTAATGADQLYQQLILDHAKQSRGARLRDPYDGESHQVNPTCGDEITLRVRLDGERVADVSYETLGCAISQASASVLVDLVANLPTRETLAIHDAFRTMIQSKGSEPGDEAVLGDAVAFAG